MSEKTIETLNAMAGVKPTETAGETVDWKARCEEAERKLQSAMVEQGRVKKLNEEKAELQRRLDEANSHSFDADAAIAELPEDVRDGIPDESAKGAAFIAHNAARKAVAKANAAHEAEMAELRNRLAERDKRDLEQRMQDFAKRVDTEFPKFLSAIGEGGELKAAWDKYMRYNNASIQKAIADCDFDSFVYHIRQFHTQELGIAAPSGASAASTVADPSTSSGGNRVVEIKPGKVYSQQEILDLYDQVEAARDRGDYAEKQRLENEIDKAQREGRVR